MFVTFPIITGCVAGCFRGRCGCVMFVANSSLDGIEIKLQQCLDNPVVV